MKLRKKTNGLLSEKKTLKENFKSKKEEKAKLEKRLSDLKREIKETIIRGESVTKILKENLEPLHKKNKEICGQVRGETLKDSGAGYSSQREKRPY